MRSGSVSSPLFSFSVLTLVDSPSSPLTDHINICGAKNGKIPRDNSGGGETLILLLSLLAATAQTSALKPRNSRDDGKIRGPLRSSGKKGCLHVHILQYHIKNSKEFKVLLSEQDVKRNSVFVCGQGKMHVVFPLVCYTYRHQDV